MKKPNNYQKIKDSGISINASLSDADLMLCLVEILADRRSDLGFGAKKVPLGWQAMEISSVEAYVNGDAVLARDDQKVSTNFTSSFVFTCLKSKGRHYNFKWLSSLS